MPDRILTDAELEEFAKLDEARTQGEWFTESTHPSVLLLTIDEHLASMSLGLDTRPRKSRYSMIPGGILPIHDGNWIAACSIMVPRMLETIEILKESLVDCVAVMTRWGNDEDGVPDEAWEAYRTAGRLIADRIDAIEKAKEGNSSG